MKRYLILLFTILLNFSSFGQEVKGYIKNDSLQPIAYARIGIVGTSIGTLSNGQGYFSLDLKNTDGKIRISAIGYSDIEITNEEFQKTDFIDLPIKLISEDNYIEEVIIELDSEIESGHTDTKTARTTWFSIPEDKNLGAEIGRLFKIKKKIKLNDFEFFIRYNNYDKVILRMNIYSEKKRRPIKNILNQDILVTLENKKTGWVEINLSDYDITLEDDVIITLEWISSSEDGSYFGLPITIPSVGSTHIYRYGSQGKWKRFGSMSTPMIIYGKEIE